MISRVWNLKINNIWFYAFPTLVGKFRWFVLVH